MTHNDGRKTMQQEIDHVRVNNPDLLAPMGEFTDNCECWGKATKGGIIYYETTTVIIDNGNYDRSVFPKTYTVFKSNSMERYNDKDTTQLGKFNAGSTESVYLLGDRGITYHNFVGEGLMKTTIDLIRVRTSNTILENEEYATDLEKLDFIKYQTLINPNYNIETDSGTVVCIENLRFRNTDKSYLDIKRFMTGLYDTSRPRSIKWNLYNWTKTENIESPNDIIIPQNLSFGCESSDSVMYVYKSENDTFTYDTKKQNNLGTLLYSAKIKTLFLDESHQIKEREIFGNTTDEERVGYYIRRAGRLLTGIKPKRFNITTGMNRSKGIRKILDIPVCKEADNDFNVGTFKKITEDSREYFRPELQAFLEQNFKGSSAERDKIHKLKQEELAKKYNKMTNEINPTSSMNDLIKMREDCDKEIITRIAKKDVLKKKQGKAYDAMNKYSEMLSSIIEIKRLELTSVSHEDQEDNGEHNQVDDEQEEDHEDHQEEDQQEDHQEEDQQEDHENEEDNGEHNQVYHQDQEDHEVQEQEEVQEDHEDKQEEDHEVQEQEDSLVNYIETITRLELIDYIKFKYNESKDRVISILNDHSLETDTFSKSILEKFTEDFDNLNKMILNKID